MLKPLLLLCTAAFLLGGCAGWRATDASPTGAPTPEAPSRRPGVPLAALVEAGSGELPALLDRLDPPLRVEEKPIENRHVPGQVDTLRVYVYDGLSFTVYDVSASGKKLLQDLTVTSDAYQAPQEARVGMTRQAVTRRLGVPNRQDDGAYVYRLGDGPIPNPILFVHFEDDTVSALEWSFYVD